MEGFYSELKSETRRLEAVKEQILIRYLGLGWKEAHHPWSANSRPYNLKELFEHLIRVVIPLKDRLELPGEAPLTLPEPPEVLPL